MQWLILDKEHQGCGRDLWEVGGECLFRGLGWSGRCRRPTFSFRRLGHHLPRRRLIIGRALGRSSGRSTCLPGAKRRDDTAAYDDTALSEEWHCLTRKAKSVRRVGRGVEPGRVDVCEVGRQACPGNEFAHCVLAGNFVGPT